MQTSDMVMVSVVASFSFLFTLGTQKEEDRIS